VIIIKKSGRQKDAMQKKEKIVKIVKKESF